MTGFILWIQKSIQQEVCMHNYLFLSYIDCHIENHCYTFVKPEYTTTSVYSIENLYTYQKKIGYGKFGVVHLAKCKTTRKLVAIKHIPKEVINSSSKSKSSLLREISVCMAFPQHVKCFYLYVHCQFFA